MGLHGIAVCITPCESKYRILTEVFLPGIFSRILPLAHKHHVRVLLFNRRGYPGSRPFDREELEVLDHAAPDAVTKLEEFMRARGKELHDALLDFATKEHLAPKSIILTGWSFGTGWMTSLLAYGPAFHTGTSEDRLPKYIRRVIAYGTLLTEFDSRRSH